MIDPLRSARRLGPILFQLPPHLKCDEALLADFLELLPADICDMPSSSGMPPGWLSQCMNCCGAGMCRCVWRNRKKLEVPKVITADFVYYRLRKPQYSETDVATIAAGARELLTTGRDLYLMFKHEETPDGALNAQRSCCGDRRLIRVDPCRPSRKRNERRSPECY